MSLRTSGSLRGNASRCRAGSWFATLQCLGSAIWRAAIGTTVSTSAGLLAPYVMGSVVEAAPTSLEGFNTGFMICGVIMLVGGIIGMSLMRPERETVGWASEMPEAVVGPA
jgi:hypothetical protein